MLSWLPDWIQAIFSIVLSIITFYYACLTRKLVQESSNAFIAVASVDLMEKQLNGCMIRVINYGPGNALNIGVKIEMISLEKIMDGAQNKIEVVQAIGTKVLCANSEAMYVVRGKYAIPEESTIIIEYNSQTGKKYRYKWEFASTSNEITFLGDTVKVKRYGEKFQTK